MVKIRAFFDDSGSHSRSTVCVVAGLLMRASPWRLFYRDWNALLRADPSIQYFKSFEASSSSGQFSNWPARETERKIEDLTKVILKHGECHFVSCVRWDDFRAATKGSKIPRVWNHPYLLCFYHTLRQVCHYMDESSFRSRPTLTLGYDRQGGYEKRAQVVFDTMRRPTEKQVPGYTMGRWLRSIAFSDDKNEIALQAADLIAWHYRDAIHNRRRVSREETPIVNQLEGLPVIGSVAGRDVLDSWVKYLPQLSSGGFRAYFAKEERARRRRKA